VLVSSTDQSLQVSLEPPQSRKGSHTVIFDAFHGVRCPDMKAFAGAFPRPDPLGAFSR
jgi:hypothetical protein